MNNVVNIKLHHKDAKAPFYATAGAKGADVFACIVNEVWVHPGQTKLIPLGFSMELPSNLAAILLPRSGLGHKSGIVLGNLVGLIDGDFRGEVHASVWNRNNDGEAFCIHPNDRLAQMMIVPAIQVEFNITDQLGTTTRGAGGFGSTGVTQ